ncbi:MAG TPA: GNAT family N-acetyltransferase [Methanocorpusculum sp.]|nr:GNAT family N-acetyltransferase [Methanocorpusculum sp.]
MDTRYSITRLSAETNLTGFDCGDEDLNNFLFEDALKNQRDLISVTKIMQQNASIIGYYTLVPDTLERGRISLSDKIEGYPYRKYPTHKLARLAVDKNYQKMGYGGKLLGEFFKDVWLLIAEEGGRFITVDARSEAVEFYKHYGFCVVKSAKDNETVPMYLDVSKYYRKTY